MRSRRHRNLTVNSWLYNNNSNNTGNRIIPNSHSLLSTRFRRSNSDNCRVSSNYHTCFERKNQLNLKKQNVVYHFQIFLFWRSTTNFCTTRPGVSIPAATPSATAVSVAAGRLPGTAAGPTAGSAAAPGPESLHRPSTTTAACYDVSNSPACLRPSKCLVRRRQQPNFELSAQ